MGEQPRVIEMRWLGVGLAACVVAAGALCCVYFGGWILCEVVGRPTSRELARRAECMANLHGIYRALLAWKTQNSALPSRLSTLAEAGLLEPSALYCPSARDLHKDTEVQYGYEPLRWATERPIVWESALNHSLWEQRGALRRWRRLVGLDLPPVRHVLFSDGSVVEQRGTEAAN